LSRSALGAGPVKRWASLSLKGTGCSVL